ncbi:MAG: peptidoglycan binding domain-containing protein, partial [Eubacterium sp.]
MDENNINQGNENVEKISHEEEHQEEEHQEIKISAVENEEALEQEKKEQETIDEEIDQEGINQKEIKDLFEKAADNESFPEDKKKRFKKPLIIVGIVLGILLITYLGVSFYFSSHFYFNSTINNVNVTGKSPEEVDQAMAKNAERYELVLEERDGFSEKITSEQVKINYISGNEINDLFKAQNAFYWPMSLFPFGHREMSVTMAFDDALLTNQIAQLSAVAGDKVVKVQNAYPKYNGTAFEIVPEVEGNEIDQVILKKKVTEAILSGKQTLNLEEEGCYKTPAFKKDHQKVNETMKKMNQLSNVIVTYTFGEKTEVPDKNTISSWMSVDDNMEVVFNNELVAQYLAALSDKYDTYGMTRSFRTSGGGTVQIYGGDYGWLIDQEAETAALIEVIKALQNVTADVAKKSEEYAASPIHAQQYKKQVKEIFEKVVEHVKGDKDIS